MLAGVVLEVRARVAHEVDVLGSLARAGRDADDARDNFDKLPAEGGKLCNVSRHSEEFLEAKEEAEGEDGTEDETGYEEEP